MSKKIQLIIGSTRQNRISPAIARWIETQVAKNDDFELEVIDLKTINLPFFNEPTSPSMAPGTSDEAKAWSAKISSADAFIILSAEYNAGYPAPLKNAIDYLKAEWQNRPVTIVSYGYGGGVSSAAQLKQVFTRLGAEIVESGVAIDIGAGILNEVGGVIELATGLEQYEAALTAALDEIAAYEKVEALAAA
jgi:NAD(P)H-dependent FMN reductase